MKATHFLLSCALFSSLCLVGCSKPAEPPLRDVEFQGQEKIPERVMNLRGTAFLDIDQTAVPESQKGPNVSFFVMLSPTQPEQGILVKAPLSVEELKKLDSAKLNVTGNVVEIDAPLLVDKLKPLGLTPKTSANGKVQMIVHEGPLVLPAASESPAEPSASPSDSGG